MGEVDGDSINIVSTRNVDLRDEIETAYKECITDAVMLNMYMAQQVHPESIYSSFLTGFYRDIQALYNMTNYVFDKELNTSKELDKLLHEIQDYIEFVASNQTPNLEIVKNGIRLFNEYAPHLFRKNLVRIA